MTAGPSPPEKMDSPPDRNPRPGQTRPAGFTGQNALSPWTEPVAATIEDAVLQTLVYADLFDYPLKTREVHRYLVGYAASLVATEDLLHDGKSLNPIVDSNPPYWFLPGREHLVALRQERESFSRRLWPAAWRWGRRIAGLPFVRLVAITGALAVENVAHPQDDIDYLLVTAKDRLWLARGLVILLVRLASLQGLHLCPNYLLAEHHLVLKEHNLYTAHELAQIVPLYGAETYQRLWDNNTWIARYLPNARPRPPARQDPGPIARGSQGLLEAVLGGRLGGALENWERRRKIPRLCQEAEQRGGSGATFTPELCKGHMDDHAALVQRRFAARLAKQRS